MNNMKILLITFAIVLIWAIAAAVLKLPILANLEFIFGLTGFLILFFRDFDEETASEREKLLRKRWLTVFSVAMVLGILFGSLWNSELFKPATHPDAPPAETAGALPFPSQ